METIRKFIDAGARKAGSFNRLAAALKTTSGNITRLTVGAGHPGDDLIVRLAAYLGEDPKKLLLINQTEKAPETARPVWTELLKRYSGAAMLILCLSSVFCWGIPCSAATVESEPGIYYRTLKRYVRTLLKILQIAADTTGETLPSRAARCSA